MQEHNRGLTCLLTFAVSVRGAARASHGGLADDSLATATAVELAARAAATLFDIRVVLGRLDESAGCHLANIVRISDRSSHSIGGQEGRGEDCDQLHFLGDLFRYLC